MSKFTLEVCADSVESVLAAEKGGADRIELCGNVVIGGTTPSESLFREIRRHSDIKIHALIRPRFGDFCYTEYEFEILDGEVIKFYYEDEMTDDEKEECIPLPEGVSREEYNNLVEKISKINKEHNF